MSSVTWYATERGEIRFNFPSVFELTSPVTDLLRQLVWRSNHLHFITGWMEKKCRSLSNMTRWGGGGGGAKWLAEALAPEVVPFPSEEIGIRFLSSWIAVSMTRCVETVAKLPGTSPMKRIEFLDSSRHNDMYWNCRRNSGEERKESLDRR